MYILEIGECQFQIIGYIEYKDLNINSIKYKDLELIYPESVELSKQDKSFEELCKNIAKELNLKIKIFTMVINSKLSVEEIKLFYLCITST